MAGIKLDQTDRKILNILQSNAKITNAQLAKDIDLSPAPTLERVKKLENLGLIESYHAKLSTKKLGLGVTTYLLVKLTRFTKENSARFVEIVNEMEAVIECHYIAGSTYHYMLKVITRDIEDYRDLIMNSFSEVEVLENMQTMVILSTVKDSTSLPIPR